MTARPALSADQREAIKYGDDTFKVRLCNYCGSLDWTVRKYGRATHKEACPNRQEAYSQTYPKRTLADVVGEVRRDEQERIKAGIETVPKWPGNAGKVLLNRADVSGVIEGSEASDAD